MPLNTRNLVSHYLVIGTDSDGIYRRIKFLSRKDAELIADQFMIRANVWAVNPHGGKKLERKYHTYIRS